QIARRASVYAGNLSFCGHCVLLQNHNMHRWNVSQRASERNRLAAFWNGRTTSVSSVGTLEEADW
ncbi:MAG: hypothetical protein WCL44_15280, partial [bacterium]